MCEFLDKVENRGIKTGIKQGLAEGRTEAKREMALSLAGLGVPLEKIAAAAKVSVETVKQWLASPQQGAAK